MIFIAFFAIDFNSLACNALDNDKGKELRVRDG